MYTCAQLPLLFGGTLFSYSRIRIFRTNNTWKIRAIIVQIYPSSMPLCIHDASYFLPFMNHLTKLTSLLRTVQMFLFKLFSSESIHRSVAIVMLAIISGCRPAWQILGFVYVRSRVLLCDVANLRSKWNFVALVHTMSCSVLHCINLCGRLLLRAEINAAGQCW